MCEYMYVSVCVCVYYVRVRGVLYIDWGWDCVTYIVIIFKLLPTTVISISLYRALTKITWCKFNYPVINKVCYCYYYYY